jgi:hypothetical protein
MSGAEFTRKKYDDYDRRLNESTEPLNYRLYPGQYYNCTISRPPNPGVLGTKGVSISASRLQVDVESDLRNIHRKISDNPELMHHPPHQSEPMVHFDDSSYQHTENCRLTNPATNNREYNKLFEKNIYIDKESLGYPTSYQKATATPGKINVHSKTLYKDCYRPDIRAPDTHAQTNIIFEDPSHAQRNMQFCVPLKRDNVCGVFTGPLNDFVYYPPVCKYYRQNTEDQ